MDTRSKELFEAAKRHIPGGVNSPVRAFGSVGRTPRFIASAHGSRIMDVDGNEMIDYVCSWGPGILGHAHPRVIEKVREACRDGLTYGAPTEKEVQMAVNTFGQGRTVYISGLPYSFENSRILHRAILWSTGSEDLLKSWFSENYNVDVHAYVKNGKFCVVNNTYEPQSTVVYKGDGSSFPLDLEANEIQWYEI